MTTNDKITPELQSLFDQALTGKAPTAEQIRNLTAGAAGRSARTSGEFRDGVKRHAVALAREAAAGGDPVELTDHAAELVSRFASEAGASDPAALAALVNRSPKGRTHKPPQDNTALHTLATDIRGAAMDGRTLDPAAYTPRGDMTEAQATVWRNQLRAGSQRASDAWNRGEQGRARELARNIASELAEGLHVEPPKDPTEGISDPRELANVMFGVHKP